MKNTKKQKNKKIIRRVLIYSIFAICLCLLVYFAICAYQGAEEPTSPTETEAPTESTSAPLPSKMIPILFWDGDSVVAQIEVRSGTKLSDAIEQFPAVPEKKGYNGKGWECNMSMADEIVNQLNVYAKYEAKTYTVRFECPSETGDKNIVERTVTYGDIIYDYPEAYDYDGKRLFSHWQYGEYDIHRNTAWEIDVDNALLTPFFRDYSYDLLYETRDDGKIVITGAKGDISNLIIPSTYRGFTVFGVAENAFKGNKNILSLHLGEGVTEIGDSAFATCEHLSTISLGKGVKTIGENAFYGIDSIVITTISMFSNVEKIGNGAFRPAVSYFSNAPFFLYGDINDYAMIEFGDENSSPFANRRLYLNNKAITEITLDKAEYVSAYAFNNCSYISKYTLGSSVKKIGTMAFYVEFTDTTSIYYEGSIDEWCAMKLDELWLAGTMNEITSDGRFALDVRYSLYCNGELVERVEFPENITAVPDLIFYGCSSIKEIVLHDNITSIGKGAFGYTSISSITLSDNIEEIGFYAFKKCNNLKASTTYGTLKYIGNEKNPYVAVISSDETLGEYIGLHENTKFIFPFSMQNSGVVDAVIPQGVKTIGDFAFRDCGYLKTVTLHDGVTQICGSAFSYCGELTSISIPSSMTKIGSYAFSNCKKLAAIELPEGLLEIGKYAFTECNALTEVIIPLSVTRIGEGIFHECTNLKKLVIPFVGESLNNDSPVYTAYKDGETEYCTINSTHTFNHLFLSNNINLTEVIVCGGNIEKFAFADDSFVGSIKRLTFLEDVGYFKDGALRGCINLEYLTIMSMDTKTETINDILYRLFDGCVPSSLHTVNIG